jgi:hypothetical protein
MGLMGRYGKAEREFSATWAPLSTITSPSALKTDKFLSFLMIEFSGRLAIAVNNQVTISDTALDNLLQEIRIYGTHAQFGAQTPIRIRAKTQNDINNIYGIGFHPRNITLKGGVATVYDGTTGNWDLKLFWIVPLFPLPMSLQLAPLYSLKGPDWAGNLFCDIDCGDGNAVGTAGAGTTYTWTAYASAQGTPTLYVSVIRPNLTVPLMNSLAPGIPFRSYKSVDSVVQAASFNLGKLTDLNIGKTVVSAHVLTGVLLAGLSPGTKAYVAGLSDNIVTSLLCSLDGKFLAMPYDGLTQQNADSLLGGQVLKVGYNVYNFIREAGNPDSAFPAQTLTSARRFELDANVVAAANQGCEVVQDEILGAPAYL